MAGDTWGRRAAQFSMLLLKLAFAFAVLWAGWVILAPGEVAAVERVIVGFVALTPANRSVWGVVVLLFGAACLLAALPMPVTAKPRRRTVVLGDDAGPELVPIAEPTTASRAPATLEGTPGEPAPSPLPILHTGEPETAELTQAEGADVGPDQAEAAADEPVRDPVLMHEDAVAQARAAAEAEPTLAHHSHLADLLKKSGDIAESEGRLDAAIAAYEESLTVRRAGLSGQAANGREQRWLWVTSESLADCREGRGQRMRAAILYQDAVRAGERAVALSPQEPQYASELSDTRGRLAALEALLVS